MYTPRLPGDGSVAKFTEEKDKGWNCSCVTDCVFTIENNNLKCAVRMRTKSSTKGGRQVCGEVDGEIDEHKCWDGWFEERQSRNRSWWRRRPNRRWRLQTVARLADRFAVHFIFKMKFSFVQCRKTPFSVSLQPNKSLRTHLTYFSTRTINIFWLVFQIPITNILGNSIFSCMNNLLKFWLPKYSAAFLSLRSQVCSSETTPYYTIYNEHGLICLVS